MIHTLRHADTPAAVSFYGSQKSHYHNPPAWNRRIMYSPKLCHWAQWLRVNIGCSTVPISLPKLFRLVRITVWIHHHHGLRGTGAVFTLASAKSHEDENNFRISEMKGRYDKMDCSSATQWQFEQMICWERVALQWRIWFGLLYYQLKKFSCLKRL